MVGEGPVEFAEAFVRNYPAGQWINTGPVSSVTGSLLGGAAGSLSLFSSTFVVATTSGRRGAVSTEPANSTVLIIGASRGLGLAVTAE